MKKTNTPTPASPATIEVQQLAALCGLTARRLEQLAAENKLPAINGGTLPMIEALRQLFAWLQRDSEALAHEKFLLCRAERQLMERQERIAGGLESKELVRYAEVERLVLMFIGKLENLPVRMASEFGLEPKIVTRLTLLLDEARSEMSALAGKA